MRTKNLFWGALVGILMIGSGLVAADEVSGSISGTMKKILDHRSDDFASIRQKGEAADQTDFKSTLTVAGAKECYISLTASPRYSDSCSVLETKNRATLTLKYKAYVKSLQGISHPSWTSWTEHTSKPEGDATYIGPDRAHPAAAVHWVLEGMNMDWYDLSVTFYSDGYTFTKQQ